MNIPEYFVDESIINSLYRSRSLKLSIPDQLPNNSYILLRAIDNHSSTAIVRVHNEEVVLLKSDKQISFNGIAPKDFYQASFCDTLSNDEIILNVCTGKPGSGKTTLATAYALYAHFNQNRKIILTKPTTTVGKTGAFGPVPGDVNEKFAPYLSSFHTVLSTINTGKSEKYINVMLDKGDLQYMPIQFTRGCTFRDCTLILDEAQNIDWHEMKTIISRIGENAKIIVLGDLGQIDTNLKLHNTGLYKLVNSNTFKKSGITSYIDLKKQYRSALCDLVEDIETELQRDNS